MTPSNPARYNTTARLLHWLIAGLIVSQYIIAQLAERAEEHGSKMAELALLANHKSIGMTVLMLALVRIIWRFVNKPPALPTAQPKWQQHLASITHWLLYFLLFAIPLSGWLMSSASAYSVSWFNLFTFPDLVAPDKSLKGFFYESHEVLAKLLFFTALLHILAALKHHFIDRDDVLRRMSSTVWLVFFLVLTVAIAFTFGHTSTSEQSEALPVHEAAQTEPSAPAEEKHSELPEWQIDYDKSTIAFTAVQAGAEFTGRFNEWQAQLQFAADNLEQSLFDVHINLGSVDTADGERDETLHSEPFFDSAHYPSARFYADNLRQAENNEFVTSAQLTIKNKSHPLNFRFTIDSNENTVTLTGQATIDRIAMGIGTGEWLDTDWVGQYVKVNVTVTASLPASH